MGMNNRLLRPLATSRFAALRTGLLGYWPMNETVTSGDVTAVDASGRGNNLTSNNSVLSTTGKINNARTFVAGNSEWLGVTSADFALGENSWTLSFWFFIPTAAPNSLMVLVAKDISGAREFNLGFTNGVVAFSGFSGAGSVFQGQTSGVSRDAWHLFHATHAANDSVINCAVDRTAAFTATRTSGTWASSTSSELTVGRRAFASPNQQFLTGDIDEFAIWGRVLSSSELDTLWNSGNGVDLLR